MSVAPTHLTHHGGCSRNGQSSRRACRRQGSSSRRLRDERQWRPGSVVIDSRGDAGLWMRRAFSTVWPSCCAHYAHIRSRSSGSGMAQGNSRIPYWRIYPVGRMERCTAAHPARWIAGMLLGLHATAAQEVDGPARYTGVGVSGRHPRPRKGLRPPRHRSRHHQDDLFSCPGERTTGAYGCAVGIAGRGARHDRSPDSPAHSRDARQPRY